MAKPDYTAAMEDGVCIECGATAVDGYACHELFGYLLAWEQYNPELHALHYWNVSCYMIQHPSAFTEQAYAGLTAIFRDAYDRDWDNATILKVTRESIAANGKIKIANPLPAERRIRVRRQWSMTIEDIYKGGDKNAAANVLAWRSRIRDELRKGH